MDYEYYYVFPDESAYDFYHQVAQEEARRAHDSVNLLNEFAPTFEEMCEMFDYMRAYMSERAFIAKMRRYVRDCYTGWRDIAVSL